MQAPEGVAVEAGPIWIPAKGELSWRISALDQGDYELAFEVNGDTVTKSLRVSDDVVRRSPIRPAKGFLSQLQFPAEDPLPEGPIRAITVTYPEGNAGFEGWESEWTWMILFFILSVVCAFALRKPLKVTI